MVRYKIISKTKKGEWITHKPVYKTAAYAMRAARFYKKKGRKVQIKDSKGKIRWHNWEVKLHLLVPIG